MSASGMLKLSGERPIGGDNRWNRFSKEVQIPKNCNTNAISAKFENNILFIQLPKNNITTTTTTPPDQLLDSTKLPPKHPKPAANQEPPKQPLSDSLEEATKQKHTDKPYTPREQKEKPKDNTLTTSPADGKNGVFAETNKTKEKRDDEQGKDGEGVRGEYGQGGKNGGSTEKDGKLDQEAPSVAGGSCNSVLENYTEVVGGLGRDLIKGGKVFNFAVTVLVALLLGIYFGNMVRPSGKPEI